MYHDPGTPSGPPLTAATMLQRGGQADLWGKFPGSTRNERANHENLPEDTRAGSV